MLNDEDTIESEGVSRKNPRPPESRVLRSSLENSLSLLQDYSSPIFKKLEA